MRGVRLTDCRVVVTGSSAGIGRETARLLAAKGAVVYAAARSAGPLEELAASTPGVVPVVADVSSDEDRAALVAAASADGPIDVLVNNAGIGWTGLVEEMPADQVRALFEVNVLGLIDLTQRVLPAMLARRRGHVVNVASIAGYVSMPPLTVYSATKFAVQGFSDGLRREVVGRGVAVTCVNPGPVRTLFGARAMLPDATSLTSGLTDRPMAGVPAWAVARAVMRAVRYGGVPGYGVVTVPRVFGLGRLGAVPGLALTVDAASLLSRERFRRS